MPKLFIVSLGCPKNLTDAEVMAGQFAAAGFELTADESEADIALINTCAFLSSAVKESEKEIKRFISLKERGKLSKIAVTGCLVERERAAILKKFPQIDAVVGINALESVCLALNGGERVIIPPAAPLSSPKLKLRLTAPHSAYLKIADGCDNRCSYCAIPMIRGRFRSKPLKEVIKEAENLARSGAREISLIAQDTTFYGTDLYGRPELYKLLKELVKIGPIKWLRLMYVYPDRLSPELLRLIRDEEKLCHYLDMPLQHISDNILRMMNRRSTGKSIRNKLAEIRKTVPDLALRTSFIVGFPGETGKDFGELRRFVADAGFDNVAVFEYSREPGTPAAELPGQTPDKVKAARLSGLVSVQSRVVDKKNKALAGATVRVLLDSPVSGRTYRDAPEIDGKVEVITDAISHKPEAIGRKTKKPYGLRPTAYGSVGVPPALKAGEFVNVKITGAAGYLRRGIIVSAKGELK
ncbi:MAG: 30S ribosomal protein S12 methylthiotransferase RimO [Elusimicrobia bacterium]|nr:30S ribosomal protein S12 methylthiotransferase RimO [Elusimicrobiota bacterium]